MRYKYCAPNNQFELFHCSTRERFNGQLLRCDSISVPFYFMTRRAIYSFGPPPWGIKNGTHSQQVQRGNYSQITTACSAEYC